MVDLELFRKLFNPLPGNHYLYVTTLVDEISFLLNEMMQKVNGRLNIVVYSKNDLELNSKLRIENIQHVKDFACTFRAVPRDHDVIVFKDIFHSHENQKMILKLAYLTLANTANIIIMEKKGILDIAQIKEMLEDYEFRAPNEIDIVDGYDLVIAKKMHMWGNGL